MRVVLNNLTGIRRKAGIGHYVSELVRGLREHFVEHHFDTFPSPWVEGSVKAWERIRQLGRRVPESPLSARPQKGSMRGWLSARARDWASWHFETFWQGDGFDLYHEPNYIPLPFDGPSIATVHDLSVMLHPDWHPADRVAYYAKHFEAGIRRCAHLLVPSEFTRRELVAQFNVAPAKVTCVPLGMRAGLRPMTGVECQPVLRSLGMPDSYLLHVGTIEPRKNLLMLMRAYGDLPAELRQRCPLVLAGSWGWNVGAIAKYFDEVARHRGVRVLGYVADPDLPALYSGARALVFPSYYEGFGLPPLEMFACGGAVIGSTAGAVVETVGRVAHLIDAEDLTAWRDAMRRAIVDDAWRQSFGNTGPALANSYTWQRCAMDTFGVYEKVLGTSHSETAANSFRRSA